MAERAGSDATGGDPSAPEDADPVSLQDVDSLALEDALAVLGEETRARIVVELGEAVREDGVTPEPLRFSELMERVGVEDSGRFNYHLGELVDAFVAKVEDGYLLRPQGRFVYRAIVAGTLTERPRLDPFEVGDCPDCEGVLTAEYPATHCLAVRCRTCGQFEHTVHLTPRGVEARSREATLDAAVRKGRHDVGLLREGVCPDCGSPVDCDLTRDGPDLCARHCDYDVYAVLTCSICDAGGVAHPAHVALTAPAVVGFFDDHGRDAHGARHWERPVVDAEAGTEVVAEDPLAVEVPFEFDGESLRVVLDEDLQVAETERSTRR